jgi:hypothetical protein
VSTTKMADSQFLAPSHAIPRRPPYVENLAHLPSPQQCVR